MKKRVLPVVSLIIVFSVVFCNVFVTHASNLTGDVNSDGKVNSTDALIVLQYAVGMNMGVKDFRAGDVNSDMLLNSVDALIILQISTELINPEDYSSVATTNRVTTTKKTTTKRTTTEEATSSPSAVYNALAAQRKFGFNKLYDKGAQWANFYLQTIRCYFTYDDKDWLIELWKGEYAMATVGCEVGFYNKEHNQALLDRPGPDYLHYPAVGDEDAMPVSMKLWQYVKSTDATPVQKIDYGKRLCWWAADFETGVLEKHRDQTTLIMIATIDFPTEGMMKLFTEQLSNKGFVEGDTNSYNDYDRYSVRGKSVTICWRNFNED